MSFYICQQSRPFWQKQGKHIEILRGNHEKIHPAKQVSYRVLGYENTFAQRHRIKYYILCSHNLLATLSRIFILIIILFQAFRACQKFLRVISKHNCHFLIKNTKIEEKKVKKAASSFLSKLISSSKFYLQVGSFNYAMNKLIFRDEFIPVKEEAVRTSLTSRHI